MIIEIVLGCSIVLLFIWVCIICKDVIKIINDQRELLKFILDNKIDIKRLFKMFDVQANFNENVMKLLDKKTSKKEPEKIFKGTKNEQIME